MPYCSSCGTNMDPHDTYCGECGAAAPQSAVPPPVQAPRPGSYPFSFHGSGGDLLILYLKTFFLSVVTLGIYQFWGRTAIRRYLAQSCEFCAGRFDYHGTGMELFIGWLKALGALIGVVCLAALAGFLLYALAGEEAAVIGGAVGFYLLIFAALPFVIVGVWKYRYSRTSYFGIRFSFRGDWKSYFGVFIGGLLLTFLTLSLYAPVWQSNIRRYVCRHSYYGNTRFDYDGRGSDLFSKYLLALFLALPTLFISLIWYQVESYRYFWNRTTFQGARFRSAITTPGLIGLALTNFLLTIFTLGIGAPWAMVRALRYLAGNLVIEGMLDLPAVRQQALPASATGEGFADLLDVHGAADIGL